MRKTFTAVICAIAVAGLSVGPALAGEVTGPPGDAGAYLVLHRGTRPEHVSNASWICRPLNGLNDFNQGPLDNRVQTPHTQGTPGEAGHGTCAGGTNFERTK